MFLYRGAVDWFTDRNVRTFHAARKASPVGEHHERKPLAVQVLNSLSRLKSRVGEPHLTGLLDDLKKTRHIHTMSMASLHVVASGCESASLRLTLASESRLAGSAGMDSSTVLVSTATTPTGIPPNLQT